MKKNKNKHKYIDLKIVTAVALFAGSIIFGAHVVAVRSENGLILDNQVSRSTQTIKEQICNATEGENCDVIYNLCKAESGCNKWAVNKNKNSTYDYSYFQINQIHIKGFNKKATIDMKCVYSLPCVSKWVNDQIKAGHGNIWVAWKKI